MMEEEDIAPKSYEETTNTEMKNQLACLLKKIKEQDLVITTLQNKLDSDIKKLEPWPLSEKLEI